MVVRNIIAAIIRLFDGTRPRRRDVAVFELFLVDCIARHVDVTRLARLQRRFAVGQAIVRDIAAIQRDIVRDSLRADAVVDIIIVRLQKVRRRRDGITRDKTVIARDLADLTALRRLDVAVREGRRIRERLRDGIKAELQRLRRNRALAFELIRLRRVINLRARLVFRRIGIGRINDIVALRCRVAAVQRNIVIDVFLLITLVLASRRILRMVVRDILVLEFARTRILVVRAFEARRILVDVRQCDDIFARLVERRTSLRLYI